MTYTFPIEQQQENDWCWDAVAVSVDHYFDPLSSWTQETFAERALGVPLPRSDQTWYLSDALAILKRLNGNPRPALSFEEVQQQLDANLPVCVQIDWNEGGSHYLVISGYSVSAGRTPQVTISDPILPNSNAIVWDFEAFVYAYSPTYASAQGAEGTWVETCLVKQ